MHSLYDFVVEPKGERYNNTKQVGDKELILNSEISNHQFVNRNAIVQSIPLLVETKIKKFDEIIVHHNVFRRWHNVRNIEKNSKSYLGKNKYAIKQDQIFAYKRNNQWKALEGYCFIKPIKSYDKFSIEKEQPLVGIMKYCDDNLKNIKIGDLIGFTPFSKYEFIINGERLYRVLTNSISIKYEYQGNEKEYNPSWTQGG
jgi:hypothetical protein|tara:strand:- start:509 stop:1108 length:600 start_codon:yes stop_codon:yes gene_type:complete